MSDQLPPAEELAPVQPLTFEQARTELERLAGALSENTIDMAEWCTGVHRTIAGYQAGVAQREASQP